MASRRRVPFAAVALLLLVTSAATAQFNSGSDGRDGVFNPTASIEIDMADHPDGIYQYTSVNIPRGVGVSFRPNAANTPVIWLVQGDCSITGSVLCSSPAFNTSIAGTAGGPGGFRGGNGVQDASDLPQQGLGPGGGKADAPGLLGGNGSYSTEGDKIEGQCSPGETYGNVYLLPLLGGAGGSGGLKCGGGGGGGAILIVSNTRITINGYLMANGTVTPNGSGGVSGGGAGSGGAIRLVAAIIEGSGVIDTRGGHTGITTTWAGSGRTRLEAFSDLFAGDIRCSAATHGMQNVLILPSNISPVLTIKSIGGILVPVNPVGSASEPDVILPGEQVNPMTIVVEASNIPLNTPITVEIKPAVGPAASATTTNATGTVASSTATVSLDIPRGGGVITSKAVTPVSPGKNTGGELKSLSYHDTGLTNGGERFKTAEVSTTLGGKSGLVYVTESGKRFPVKSQE